MEREERRDGVRLAGTRPIELFREMVAGALAHQRVKADPMAEYYLSSLLSEFVSSKRMNDEPLAEIYLKALNSGKAEQGRLLKQLGDISLFTSGFFSESLKRKIVDIDYYISMGAASYATLASIHDINSRSSTLADLFTELSEKFGVFVDVLNEVSERSRLTDSRDILRVYERWLRTKSRQAGRILRESGIEPVDMPLAPVQ